MYIYLYIYIIIYIYMYMCVCASLVNTWFDPLVDASGVNRVCKPSCNVFVAGAPTFPVQKRKHSTCPLLNCMILHHRFVGYCWLVSSRLRKQQLFWGPKYWSQKKIHQGCQVFDSKNHQGCQVFEPPSCQKILEFALAAHRESARSPVLHPKPIPMPPGISCNMQMSSVQNPCWLMIIGDYTTQYIGDCSNPIGESL